jgi:ribonuclease P protein component
VAYAIGRSVGTAVVRNRMRRRLRHAVAELQADHRLPQGISLIIVQPDAVELDAAELRSSLRGLFADLGVSG